MKIRIDDLQKTIIFLLSNIKESVGDVVEIKNDFYWDVHSEELYNPYEQPKQLTLGQLFEDLKEINRLKKHPDAAISYDLNRISNLLKAISFENPLAF